MRRAEWIQWAILASIGQRTMDGEESVREIILLADAIEKSDMAPWDTEDDPYAAIAAATNRVAVEEVSALEREACAKIADEAAVRRFSGRIGRRTSAVYTAAALDIAKEIRARGTI